MLWSRDKAWGDKLREDAEAKGKGVYREGTLIVELAKFPQKFVLVVRRAKRSKLLIYPADLARYKSAVQVPDGVTWTSQESTMRRWQCEWQE